MQRCPNCDGPVELVYQGDHHYAYRALIAFDMARIKLMAIEAFVRACEGRHFMRPSLGMSKIIHDELQVARRVLNEHGHYRD